MLPEGRGVAVKICGLTTPEDAAVCVRLGVWGIGLVFAEASPRRVDVVTASSITTVVPATVARVGVFVGASPAEMTRVARLVGLTHIQIHGDADPDETRRVSGLPVIQGIGVRDAASLERARASTADLVMLDAAVAGRDGGTGASFDWSLLADTPLGRPFALAGGLRPETVGDATVRLRPALVDVSSGVEGGTGRKDPERVTAFVAAVAAVGQAIA